MLNLPLIFYGIFIAGFIFSTLAVLYHLWFYQMNRTTAFVITSLFVAGAIVLLLVNFGLAGQIAWENFNIYFNF